MERSGVDFLKFSKALEIMENGGKVKTPECTDRYYYDFKDGELRYRWNSGVTIEHYTKSIPLELIVRDDWEEVIEPLKEAFAEKCYTARCPYCGKLNCYYGDVFSTPQICEGILCKKKFKLVSRENDTIKIRDDSIEEINIPKAKFEPAPVLPKGKFCLRKSPPELGVFEINIYGLEDHKKRLHDKIEKCNEDITYHLENNNFEIVKYLNKKREWLKECLDALNKQD